MNFFEQMSKDGAPGKTRKTSGNSGIRASDKSKKRGSAGYVAPDDELAMRFRQPDFRTASTDLVWAETSSDDRLRRSHLDLLMPEMPISTNHSLSFRVGEYSVHSLLAKGGSASVYMGSHVHTGQLVAIKMVDRKRAEVEEMKEGISEFKILKTLHHKHIIKVLHAEENESRVGLVLEYAASGDLLTHIRLQPIARPRSSSLSLSDTPSICRSRSSSAGTAESSRTLTSRKRKIYAAANYQTHRYEEKEARRLFKQLLSAVHHTHLQGYVHRDIKPENIFIDVNDNVLLGDFSLATTWRPKMTHAGSCGTLHYAAPEVLGEKRYVGPEVDIWSCGAVLYFMLTGEKPFQAKNDLDVLRNVKKGRKKMVDKKLVSRAARDLVDRMLEPNPLKRIAMIDILKHEWIKPTLKVRKALRKHTEGDLPTKMEELRSTRKVQSTEALSTSPSFSWSKKKREAAPESKNSVQSLLFSIQE